MKYLGYITILVVLAACTSQPESAEEAEDIAEVNDQPSSDKSIENDSIIECTGTISVPPEASVSLHTPIGGIISSIKVIEGEKVKKGQTLATLEHLSVIKIQEDYLTSKSAYEYAKKEYDRKELLYNKRTISEKEFDAAKEAYSSAMARFQSMKSQIEFLGLSESKLDQGSIQKQIVIRSPINGYITHINTHLGSYAEQNTEIFNLIDDSHKHVHLTVFAEDASRLREGQEISLRTADNDKVHTAEIYLIGKNIDPGKNAVDVHGHFKGETEDLIVGTFVFAKIYVK